MNQKSFPLTIIIFILLALLITSAVLIAPYTGNTERVSVSSSEEEGNGASTFHDVSADGRYVTFVSGATNFAVGDTNDAADIFVRDRTTGETTIVSVSSGGVYGNAISSFPTISGNGRYVAFHSEATNLVANDTNGWDDIFVHDRVTENTTRISVASDGTQGDDHSLFQNLSYDGNLITFQSAASTLVANDTNGFQDIFLHNQTTGETTRVSVASDGTQSNNTSLYHDFAAYGCTVVFLSYASNLVPGDTNGFGDVFVHDCTTGTTTRVSVSSTGEQANDHSSSFGDMGISGDGRYVTFHSNATNLVAGDTNGVQDIFVHDRNTGATTRVSVNSDGTQANGSSAVPTLSADGRYVLFRSDATNLVPNDTNGATDVFVHDRETALTIRVSVDSNGVQGNGTSSLFIGTPHISLDGRFATFNSLATNLVPNDTNGLYDIFIHQIPESFELEEEEEPDALPETGFARGTTTDLPDQPEALMYSSSDLVLAIPELDVEIEIVGVPMVNGAWDASWLYRSAGWLEGSAYPTWQGNTILTGHVWDANNRPGPFARIKYLQYGDRIEINAWGQTYIYEVRESKLVLPGKVDEVFRHEEYDYVTLLTCEFYNPLTGNYILRRMVRAVLVDVQ